MPASDDELMRQVDRLVALSRQERARLSASMPNPSEEWLEAAARLNEIQQRTSAAPDGSLDRPLEEALGQEVPVVQESG